MQSGRLVVVAHVTLVTDGELMTTLRATPCQHSPSVRSLHAHTEPVLFGAAAIIGLKSTFWHLKSLLDDICEGADISIHRTPREHQPKRRGTGALLPVH